MSQHRPAGVKKGRKNGPVNALTSGAHEAGADDDADLPGPPGPWLAAATAAASASSSDATRKRPPAEEHEPAAHFDMDAQLGDLRTEIRASVDNMEGSLLGKFSSALRAATDHADKRADKIQSDVQSLATRQDVAEKDNTALWESVNSLQRALALLDFDRDIDTKILKIDCSVQVDMGSVREAIGPWLQLASLQPDAVVLEIRFAIPWYRWPGSVKVQKDVRATPSGPGKLDAVFCEYCG